MKWGTFDPILFLNRNLGLSCRLVHNRTNAPIKQFPYFILEISFDHYYKPN
jgi:hypothetical protein